MAKSKKPGRKHGPKKEEAVPPSDARPPLDYRDEARRLVHSGQVRPTHEEHV